MTPDQERVLRACHAICHLLAEEALTRIDMSLPASERTGHGQRTADEHDAWLERQAAMLRALLEALGEPQ